MTQKISEPLNILVTIDKKYIEPLCVMLESYAELHRDIFTRVYIAHSSLSDDDIALIKQRACGESIEIHNVRITERWFKDTPVLERLPEESFYRLTAFHYLPAEVRRCLYLDPDIIIRKSLRPLYETELDGHYIAAASHTYGFKNRFNLSRLNMSENERYINSGVMLMNLEKIREDFTLDTVLEALNENIRRLLLGDQDLINILFGANAVLVDENIWNLDERTLRHNEENFTLRDAGERTAIVHYNGKHKPWLEGYKGELDEFYPPVKNKGPAPKGKWKAQARALLEIMRPTKLQAAYIAGLVGIISLSVFSWLFFGKELLKILEEPALFRAWLDKFGPFDELAFIFIRAAQTVIKFIPAEPLEIASGYAWGAVPGMLYCVIGNMLGTLVILALTRRLGQSFVDAFVPSKNLKTLSLFRNSKSVYALLFFLYLIPGSPKDGFTYFVGLLPVKTLPFMVITFIARMPSVLSSTLCGATLAEKDYLTSALIFAATILLAALGGIAYKAYTKRKLADPAAQVV